VARPTLSLEAVLGEMKARALEKRQLLVRLTLVFALFSALLSVGSLAGGFAAALAFGLSLLVGVTYTGMVVQALCVPGSPEEIGGLWRTITPVLAKLIWVSLVAAIGVAGGLLLLIVPGLILLTIWSVAQPVVVVERKGVFESLGRSAELVRGNGLRVFLFLLVLGLLALLASTFALLISFPFGTGVAGTAVGSFLLAIAVNPLTAVGPAALYNCLMGISTEDTGEERTQGPELLQPDDAEHDTTPNDFTRTGGR
jgi:hypothetical protein